MGDTIVTDGDAYLLISEIAEPTLIDNGICDAGVSIITGGRLPEYTGPTEITPNERTQYLETESKSVLSRVKINPIPSNYGLITWNGTTLTVS